MIDRPARSRDHGCLFEEELAMQYATLGASGLFVSRLCLGTMTFGGSDNAVGRAIGRIDAKGADAILGASIEAGINMVDTADVYGGGRSEELLGQVLGDRRQKLIIATKVGGKVGPGVNEVGQSREHMMASLNGSLRRLSTDYIDLYQVHNFDPLTPMDSILRTMDDMVRQGKVRHIGCSNYAAWQLMKALGISARAGFESFTSVQAYYSLAGRDVEREIVPVVTDQSLGLLCWSPLAGGMLSGKFDRNGANDSTARRALIQFPPVDQERTYDVIDVLKSIAESHQSMPAQVALAWLLSKSVVSSVIVGVKGSEQLLTNIGALDLDLTPEDLRRLDDVSALPASYPGWIHSYNAQARVPQGHSWTGKHWTLGEAPV